MSQFAPPPSDTERKIFESDAIYRRLEMVETDARTFPSKVKIRYQQQMDKALWRDGWRWFWLCMLSVLVVVGGGPVLGTLIMCAVTAFYATKLLRLQHHLSAGCRREIQHSPYAIERTSLYKKLDAIWES